MISGPFLLKGFIDLWFLEIRQESLFSSCLNQRLFSLKQKGTLLLVSSVLGVHVTFHS